jgi:hypothetical protein
MPPAKTDLERLGNAFRHSWLNSERCVEFLEGDVVRRQNIVVLGDGANEQTKGWRSDQSPLALADLVCVVSTCFDVEPARNFLTISVGCALVGVVGALRLAAGDEFPADDHPTGGERDFFADLSLHVPSGLLDGRRDELGADVPLGEVGLVQGAPRERQSSSPDAARTSRVTRTG